MAGVIQLCLLRNIFHSLFHDPSGKQGLRHLEIHYGGGLSRCVWPLHMLINLPNDALSTREPFILPGLLLTNMNARKFCLLFPDPAPALCVLLCFPHP